MSKSAESKFVQAGIDAREKRKAARIRRRNWLAVQAWRHPGAGAHVDRKKQQNKKACRGQVKETDR